MIARDGAVWLPAVLTVLGGQTRHPDSVVGVDAGSTDATADILIESLGADRVVELPMEAGRRAPGFGEAVVAGLRSGVLRSDADETFDAEATEWIWLLHDDSAPAPDCLEHLLAAADAHPRAGILGPKALGWHDRRLLLEVGFTITGSGRRVTGLERREHDQGQHDNRSEVHAVGTAGILIRRDVWEDLGGFDPALPLFRDDLDLCWRAWRAGHEVRVVPTAVVHHREASYHGRREGSTAPGRGHRLDRRSAMHVLLVQTPGWRLPFTFIRLAFGSLLRSLLYVLGKDLRRAGDELMAVGAIIAHPGRVMSARRRTHATSTVSSHAAVGEFRPRALAQARVALEAFGGMLTAGRIGSSSAVGALESGPISDDADLFEDPAGGWLRRVFGRPGVGIFLSLLILAIVSFRGLLWGDGTLLGGALLPSPEGAGDLWTTYLNPWHDIGPGSTTPTAPFIAVLAAIATVLLGKAPLMVGTVLLLAVPISGLSVWWSLRGVVLSSGVRVWAAFAYALVPAIAGGIAGGRLGVLLAAILLPPTARAMVRALTAPLPGLVPASGRTAWWAGFLLAVCVACAPILWPLAFLAVVVAVIAALRRGALVLTLLRGIVIVLVPFVLLLPWSAYLLTHPAMMLADLGLADPSLADPLATPLGIAFLQPGGPGATPIWIGIGIVVAALLALLRRERRSAILVAWGVALVALVTGIITSKIRITVPGVADPQAVWPGVATVVLAAALIVAIAIAGDGVRGTMSSATFGWRQPVSLFATVIAIIGPVVWAVLWIPGAGDPLRRGDPQVLPPFVMAEALGPQAPRALLLHPTSADNVDYALINGAGPQLGDAEAAPPAEDYAVLDDLVAGLVSGRAGDEVAGLTRYAVRYVVLEATAESEQMARTLDSVPGMRRLAGQEGEILWRVNGDTARVSMVSDTDEAVPVTVVDGVSADPLAAEDLPVAGPGELRVAQTADAGWRAVVGGEALAAQVGGLQSFAVPAAVSANEPLTISFDRSPRSRWMWFQLIAIIIVIVLALPGRRRITDEDIADAGTDEDDVDVLAKDGVRESSHVTLVSNAGGEVS